EALLRLRHLSPAGGAARGRQRRRRSRALRQRCAAAHLAQAARHQADRRPEPAAARARRGVLAQCGEAAQAAGVRMSRVGKIAGEPLPAWEKARRRFCPRGKRGAGAFARPTLVAALLACAPAVADDYPTRPIRAITATSAGGTSDIFMRLIGERIQKDWGQPIIVENRPGGNMMIGGRACADAPNDGYTICILPIETLS